MSTEFWQTVMDQNSDAGFRAWGAELNAKLVAAGLVQTADTGQINWTTVTRAAANSNAGYEIWGFNDSLQGSAPIYLRLDFGSGSATNIPRIRLTVGTSTNGSGTIGGSATAVRTISASAGTTAGIANYASYLCIAEGFVGLVWKAGGSTAAYAWGGFMICRSCDSDGVPDGRGCHIIFHSNSGGANSDTANQSIRFTATAVVYSQNALVLSIYVPGNVTSSMVGSDFQAYLAWMVNPQVLPCFALCGVFLAELTLGNTFTATLVGGSARTYIQTDLQIGQTCETAGASVGLCMLWE
jgi:hypothetical protein